MDKFRAGNVKKFLPNWQQITKNSEILETVQGTKIQFCTIPPSIVKNNPKFTQPGLMLLIMKYLSFSRKE